MNLYDPTTSIFERDGIEDLQEAVEYQEQHGNLDFIVRKRPMYVIRGAWHAQAPDTNHNIVGFGLEKLPLIPSILITENHGCIFFGTPGQCHQVRDLCEQDAVVGYWGNRNSLVPIYKQDMTHYIAVPTKNRNPYPKKWDLDADNIIKKIDYK